MENLDVIVSYIWQLKAKLSIISYFPQVKWVNNWHKRYHKKSLDFCRDLRKVSCRDQWCHWDHTGLQDREATWQKQCSWQIPAAWWIFTIYLPVSIGCLISISDSQRWRKLHVARIWRFCWCGFDGDPLFNAFLMLIKTIMNAIGVVPSREARAFQQEYECHSLVLLRSFISLLLMFLEKNTLCIFRIKTRS